MYKDFKIAVYGDWMEDVWYEANSIKLCPSFPVLDIIDPRELKNNPGGAGNVAMCIEVLGAKVHGYYIDRQVSFHKKTRYIYQDRILFRISEHPEISVFDAMEIANNLISRLGEYDGVILADYNKGALPSVVIEQIMVACKKAGVPVFVDPKFDNWKCYKGATIFKPNWAEAENYRPHGSLSEKAWRTSEELNFKYCIITASEHGMFIGSPTKKGHTDFWTVPGRGTEAVDVTGAGDVCIAAMALEYLRTNDILKACHVANIAGSLVVQKRGVAQITVDELRKAEAWNE